MGLLLLGLISATKEGINSVIFFLLLYVLSNILFFIFLLLTRNIRTNNIITFLSDFYIGSKNNTLVFFVITILFFSLAGIPPLAGFFAKLFVLMQAISSKLHLLTIIVLLLSLITTFYYVRIIKII
jgi:NADH-quinone oxidoreductase subunit N